MQLTILIKRGLVVFDGGPISAGDFLLDFNDLMLAQLRENPLNFIDAARFHFDGSDTPPLRLSAGPHPLIGVALLNHDALV